MLRKIFLVRCEGIRVKRLGFFVRVLLGDGLGNFSLILNCIEMVLRINVF